MRIVCDTAEVPSGIPARLSRGGVEVEIARLAAGDYALPGGLLIERKSPRDLVDSLLSERLYEQLTDLCEAQTPVALLIEGDSWSGDRRLRTPILARFYRWASAQPQLSVWYSPDAAWTARLLRSLGDGRPDGPITTTRRRPRTRTPAESLRGLVAGVGPRSADRLIARFGSIRGVALASRSDLCETIGATRGAALHARLNAVQ